MSLKKKISKLMAAQKKHHAPDKILIYLVFSIAILGLVFLSSSSSVISYEKFGDAYYYLKHQLFGMFLGLAAFWFFAKIDYHYWQKYALGFLIFSIFLLLLVFIPGLSANYGKARSWINIFGYSLQPSELVKLSFLLYLAAWLENRRGELHDFSRGIGPFVAILALIGFLMIMQPDIGTLSIIAVTSLIVYFVGGGKTTHIAAIMLIGIIGFAVMIYFKPYQLNRFKCLIDADLYKQDICYQVNQSLIAVGSGGLWGMGLGDSRQKYFYLPEVSGDSIFAIISEESGFIFGLLLISAYLLLFYRGYLISKKAPDGFGKILAIGIVSWIVIQAMINIGGIINVMPMTGVPLPLISYGGSAILAALSACGVLVNISKQTALR